MNCTNSLQQSVINNKKITGYSALRPLSSDVNAIHALDLEHVFIGGDFTNVGGNANSDYITMWNGVTNTYNALGNIPLNNGVNAIYALDLEHVFIGGNFTNVGGNANSDYITMWNGTTNTYNALGTIALSGEVNAIYALDLEHVFIGGNFRNAGGITGANFIIMWNGVANTYTKLGNIPLSSKVNAIYALDLEHVFIGGNFENVGGDSTSDYITRWNGVTNIYTKLNVVLGTYVFAIYALDLEHVFIGGNFTNVGGITGVNYIIMWDGVANTYTKLGNITLIAKVTAIHAFDNNRVYIGGYFDNVGGNTNSDYITMWNGTTYNALRNVSLSTSSFDRVSAIYVLDPEHVFIGGNFTDGATIADADNIIMWRGI